MIDFSYGDELKKHKKSFTTMVDSIINEVNSIAEEYDNLWQSCEIDRKELAAAIEDSIKLLHNNKLKTEKPLNLMERKDVPEVLNTLASLLDNNPELQHKLETNAKIIESRYALINKKSIKLLNVEKKLSIYHVNEKDYDDEVVIDLKHKKESNILPFKPKEESNTVTTDDIKTILSEANDDLDKMFNSSYEVEEDNDIYQQILINNHHSLQQLCEMYYDNPSYWHYIYTYSNNAELIDNICEVRNITVEEFSKTPNLLRGYTLAFPKELVVHEILPKGSRLSKAA